MVEETSQTTPLHNVTMEHMIDMPEILWMIREMLFPNLYRNKVHAVYLSLLEDFDMVDTFSRGQ